MMGSLMQDLRYAVRMIIKSPALTLVALISLALGIGANTAIFSVINGVLLKTVAIRDPDQVVILYANNNVSYPDYVDYRDKNDVFSGLIAYTPIPLSLSAGDRPERTFGWIVSSNYFPVLGVKAALGRTLGPQDGQAPGASPVAMLSYNIWQTRFGGDPNIIGRTITLNGQIFTVVGVVEEGFGGTVPVFSPDIWVPIMMQGQLVPGPDLLNKRDHRWLELSGRLKPGIDLAKAQAAINTITGQLEQAYPEARLRSNIILYDIGNGDPAMRRDLFPVAIILMLMVGLVLLIACANVANLLLARASARKKEIAMRLAMGATRKRLVRQLLTESVVLALLGGVLALAVAVWTNRSLASFSFPVSGPVKLNLGLDLSVFAYTFILSVVTGLVFGLLPAIQSSKPDVMPILKGEIPLKTRGFRKFSLRNLLVMAQVAVSLVLLIVAGLLIRSLDAARGIDPGFNPQNTLTMAADLSLNNYSDEQIQLFFRQLVDNVKALPGVQSVSLARNIPLSIIGDESEGRREITLEGQLDSPEGNAGQANNRNVDHNIVAPNYFETLGISILRGRDFNDQDREGSKEVAVVNETMARSFWPSTDPLGKRFSISGPGGPYIEVVGVVKDSKYRTIGEAPRAFLFIPLLQHKQTGMRLVVRSAGNMQDLAASVRGVVENLDRNLPIFDLKTMSEQMSDALFLPKTGATLFTIIGFLGLLLAVVGVYGVISYFVSQRTHEIGIRLALGAQQKNIIWMVISQGMIIVMIGVIFGLVGAFAITRIMGSVLYGVSVNDPITFLGVLLLLVGVATFANYIPARRAANVDPMISLRYE